MTDTQTAAEAVDINETDRINPPMLALFRVIVAMLWIENSQWKKPDSFGSLEKFAQYGVDDPVFGPWASFSEAVLIPNIEFFGYIILLSEAALGAFLLVGLFTRAFALIGIAQSVVILLSVLNAVAVVDGSPKRFEWEWSYYLMIAAHIGLYATAAGRSIGLDAVLRPRLARSDSKIAALLMRAT